MFRQLLVGVTLNGLRKSVSCIALSAVVCGGWAVPAPANAGVGATTQVSKDPFVDPLDAPAVLHPSLMGRPMMAVASAGARLVSVGMRGLIAVSDNKGQSWTQVASPVSSDLLALSFPTPSEGWAVGHDGVVLHTSDGGTSWVKQFDGRMAAASLVDFYKARIAAGDVTLQAFLDQLTLNYKAGPSLPLLDVWFRDTQHGIAVGPFGMAIATDDAGQHWHPMLDRIENPQFLHLNAIREVAGEVYIAAEQGTVFKLDHECGQFKPVATGYMGSFFGLTGKDDVLLAYGLKGTIYRSADRGATWVQLTSPLRGSVTSAAYLSEQKTFILATAAGETALTDASAQALQLLKTRQPSPITGVQALGHGQVLLSTLNGLSVAALH